MLGLPDQGISSDVVNDFVGKLTEFLLAYLEGGAIEVLVLDL